jgi:hypothetical protein
MANLQVENVPEDFLARLQRRKPVKLGRPAAGFLTAAREERERSR